MNKMLQVSLISDTHGKHNQITKDLPGGDILIHAGDFMNSGWNEMEALMFFKWFDEIHNYDTKVFIAGNHDRWAETDPDEFKFSLKGYKTINYLEDTYMSLFVNEEEDLKIYGSPWQPEFYNWAFNLPRNGEEMKARWDAIPTDTDILVTHGPPFGYLDIPGGQNIHVGCEMLRHRVDTIRPKIHVCGHIHGSWGHYFNGHTHFFNASVLNERYSYSHSPWNFEWNPVTNEINFM